LDADYPEYGVLIPCRNTINYPYLFELIDELGYQGWIGCEYKPLNSTLAGLKWASAYGIGRSSPR